MIEATRKCNGADCRDFNGHSDIPEVLVGVRAGVRHGLWRVHRGAGEVPGRPGAVQLNAALACIYDWLVFRALLA